jgi:hypothetical protein
MFRDLRSFRTIAFRAPDIPDLKALVQIFPPNKIQVADLPFDQNNSSKIDILHCYYLADREYSSKPIPQNKKVKIKQHSLYKYNMYFISIPIDHSYIYFVAVPFLPMAIDVYPILREGMRGRGVHYKRFKLPELLSMVRTDRNLDGAIKITRVRCKVDGDNLLDTIVFKGKEVTHSSTFRNAVDYISEEGPTLSPERICLTYTEKCNRFTFEADHSGHCKFWLAKNAANLPCLSDIIKFLSQEHLLSESASFPFMPALRNEEDDSENA